MNQPPPRSHDARIERHGKEWSEELTKLVASRVRHYREKRGMSTQKLADACTAAGYEVSRTVLVNLENAVTSRRRESVSLSLLLVLARVLDVPPVMLMLPIGSNEDVEILPGVHAGPWAAAEWIAGRSNLAQRWGSDEDVRYGLHLDATDPAEFEHNARPITLYRDHTAYVADFVEWRPVDTGKAMAAVKDLVRVRREMRETGLAVPELYGLIAEAVSAQEGARG